MADRGILPKVLGHRSQYGTPTYGIFMSASGVLCLCWMSFSEVIDMLNVLYCIAQLIEFAAFVQLRIKHPDMPRPFKIPLGTVGVSVMLLVPALFCMVIISFSSVTTLVTITGITLFGFVLQYFLNIANERQWFLFQDSITMYSRGSYGYEHMSSEERVTREGEREAAALRGGCSQERYDYESIPHMELPRAVEQ